MTKLPKRQRTGIGKFLALKRPLKELIVSQRENSRAVTTVMIRLKAKELARQTNVADFVGGLRWCGRFMRRNCLSVRLRTVGQKLSENWLPSVCFLTKGGTCHTSGSCFQHGRSAYVI